MGYSIRVRKMLAIAMMVLSSVPLACGCWRLYVWKWGQPSEFLMAPRVRYKNWQELSASYEAEADKARQVKPQTDADIKKAEHLSELSEILVREHSNAVARVRGQELWFGLIGIVGAFALLLAGFYRLDKLPTIG